MKSKIYRKIDKNKKNKIKIVSIFFYFFFLIKTNFDKNFTDKIRRKEDKNLFKD